MSLKLHDTSGGWRPRAAPIALVLVLALVFVLLTGLIDGGVGVTARQLRVQPRFPLATALPGLLPDDFRMIGQLRKGGMHLLSGYLPHSPWPYLAMLVALILIVLAWRLEPPLFPRRTRGKRLLAGGVSAAMLVSMLAGLSPWGKIYNSRVLW